MGPVCAHHVPVLRSGRCSAPMKISPSFDRFSSLLGFVPFTRWSTECEGVAMDAWSAGNNAMKLDFLEAWPNECQACQQYPHVMCKDVASLNGDGVATHWMSGCSAIVHFIQGRKGGVA